MSTPTKTIRMAFGSVWTNYRPYGGYMQRSDSEILANLRGPHTNIPEALKCVFCLTKLCHYVVWGTYDPGCINLFIQNNIPVHDAGDGERMAYGACAKHGLMLLDLPASPHEMRPEHVSMLIESANLPPDERAELLAAWDAEKKLS